MRTIHTRAMGKAPIGEVETFFRSRMARRALFVVVELGPWQRFPPLGFAAGEAVQQAS